MAEPASASCTRAHIDAVKHHQIGILLFAVSDNKQSDLVFVTRKNERSTNVIFNSEHFVKSLVNSFMTVIATIITNMKVSQTVVLFNIIF